jgi:hypothetical protein
MKKLLCIMFALLLVFGVCMSPVMASESDNLDDESYVESSDSSTMDDDSTPVIEDEILSDDSAIAVDEEEDTSEVTIAPADEDFSIDEGNIDGDTLEADDQIDTDSTPAVEDEEVYEEN